MVALILIACTRPSDDDALALLARASLDLRGVRPTAEEVEWVRTDPSTLDTWIDAYLHDDRFGTRMRGLFAPVWRTRAIEADHAEPDYGIDDEVAFTTSLGEEPLRMLGWVADHDLPVTDLVTGDYTVINEDLARFYPSDYPEGGDGWQVAHYTDGRPTAGVLSTSGFYWRFPTTISNANRGRANAVSRIFLCNDYLTRDVVFDPSVSLVDEAAIADAVEHNPSCASCHVSLDPLASAFWGFSVWDPYSPEDLAHYHPERERDWQATTGHPPTYFGTPVATLTDLGHALARDDRFISCFVQQTWEALLQRPPTVGDTDTLTAHREDFLAGGVTLRALVGSIVAGDAWRGPIRAAGGGPVKILDPDQLASVVEDLTGYRFVVDGHDVIATDLYGMRSLVGGSSSGAGTTSASVPTPALVLLQERLAQGAGMYAATHDHDEPDDARLFTVGWDATPESDRDAMASQVQALFARVLTQPVEADDPEVDRALALWSEVHAAEGDAVGAWAGVLTSLLRRPELLVY